MEGKARAVRIAPAGQPPRFPTSGVTGRSLCPEPGKSRRSHLWSARAAPHCHGRGKFSFEVNKIAKSTSIRPRNPTKLLHNVHRSLARNVFKNQVSKSTSFACGRRFVLEVLAALLLLRQVKCQCVFIQQYVYDITHLPSEECFQICKFQISTS